MNKQQSIRELLGIKQVDLAMILKVTRSQLAMFEIGKRDLPVDAKLKLAEILKHAKETEVSIEKIKQNSEEEKEVLKEFLLINQHQQLIVKKRLKAFYRKQNTQNATLKVVSFLKKQSAINKEPENLLFKVIDSKARENKKSLKVQLKLQVKNEVLAAEAKILKKLLLKIQ